MRKPEVSKIIQRVYYITLVSYQNMGRLCIPRLVNVNQLILSSTHNVSSQLATKLADGRQTITMIC